MRHFSGNFTAKAMCLGIATSLSVLVQAAPGDDYEAAWAQLKNLAGTWDSHIVGGNGDRAIISYHLTSGGSVLFEEFIGPTPDGVRDMATAYHRDDKDLIATHYCGMGNQPRMKAASYDPDARLLRFDFWDVTHLPDPATYHTTNTAILLNFDSSVRRRGCARMNGRYTVCIA